MNRLIMVIMLNKLNIGMTYMNEEILPLQFGEMPECFKKHIDDYLLSFGVDLNNVKKTYEPPSIYTHDHISKNTRYSQF